MRVNNCEIILYEQEEELLNYIKGNYDYIYIKHNKDVDTETGELKKLHYHVIIKLVNARSIKSIANEFKINDNRIEIIRNMKGAVQYLIHKNNPDKYQYALEEIETNINIQKYLEEDLCETAVIETIINYIENKEYIDNLELMKYVFYNGYLYTYRKNYLIFRNIIEQKNKALTIKK